MLCAICGKRKAKRQCPAVHGEICALCCGTERENSLTCPLDCGYLREAHRYEWERSDGEPLKELPHSQYEINDNFLYHNEALVGGLAIALLRRALELPAVQDSDLIEAVNALIRTRETLSSGLIYDSVPPGPMAEALYRALQSNLETFLENAAKEKPIKDDTVLKGLVFLERLAVARGNGRPRGRSFLGFLHVQFPQVAESVATETTPGGLILPG